MGHTVSRVSPKADSGVGRTDVKQRARQQDEHRGERKCTERDRASGMAYALGVLLDVWNIARPSRELQNRSRGLGRRCQRCWLISPSLPRREDGEGGEEEAIKKSPPPTLSPRPTGRKKSMTGHTIGRVTAGRMACGAEIGKTGLTPCVVNTDQRESSFSPCRNLITRE